MSRRLLSLLCIFGTEQEFAIDNSNNDIDDPTSFLALEVERILLEDDSELIFGQFPYANGAWDTRKGVFSITHEDDEGTVLRGITVLDEFYPRPLVTYSNGSRLSLGMLGELHDILGLVTSTYVRDEIPNYPPFHASDYPKLVSTPEFDALAARLELR